MLLSGYDLLYITQNDIKVSVLEEYLAHQPLEDYNKIKNKKIIDCIPKNRRISKELGGFILDSWQCCKQGLDNK